MPVVRFLWIRLAPIPAILLALFFLGAGGACSDPEPNCMRAGTCQCRVQTDCPEGEHCVDGQCRPIEGTGPALKGFGETCLQNSDCLSAACLPAGPGNGAVCTQSCEDSPCPVGWTCKQHLDVDTGSVRWCVQIIPARLCQGCSVDAQCNAIGDRCLNLTDTETVCGLDCSAESCPGGYACQEISLPEGLVKQCLPEGGSCDCTPDTLGLVRTCSIGNAHGVCWGERICQPSEPLPDWSDCDAFEPRSEQCNGMDDDCDGLTDQEDPSLDLSILPPEPAYPNCQEGTGSCIGRWRCELDAESGIWDWVCGATDPEDEICNGIDDNCDGRADEIFLDEEGRYVHLNHCGHCGRDCLVILPDLATDEFGQVLLSAATCELRNGEPVCVPRLCAPGHYPYPELEPIACSTLVSPFCQPCTEHADCRVSSDRCVDMPADPGTFCAQSCDPASPYDSCSGALNVRDCCPEGSHCDLVNGMRMCMPDSGSCTCNEDRLGETRACIILGGGGELCQGEQVCRQIGDETAWGECEQSDVAVEVCDGLDNNCDGQIDEGFRDEQGAYSSDEHCGACHVNCLARWDQDIQHAIGGCVDEGNDQVDCAIVACTVEDWAVGAPCRSNDTCPFGWICDETVHHCTLLECPQAPCGESCSDDQHCRGLAGPNAFCSGGICHKTFSFVDLNVVDVDGCECSQVDSEQDDPDVSLDYPEPGMAYVDRDCDGIDGNASTAIFVREGAEGDGSRHAPFGSLRLAILAFDLARHSSILVAAGSYRENIEIHEGLRLYGGYSHDFGDRDVALYPTLIAGSQPDPGQAPGTVSIQGVQTLRTVLSGFVVQGYDVFTVASTGQAADSSYALYLSDCNHKLEIMNNLILGGRGGDGNDGGSGGPGNNGGNGEEGSDTFECPNSPSCTSMTQSGGNGGTNTGCSSAAGRPGATARDSSYSQDYSTGGLDGLGGDNSTYYNDPSAWDPIPNELCKYDCQVGGIRNTANGGDAQSGQDGASGSGGAGCSQPTGRIVDGRWEALNANPGSQGQAGSGGGGGGAGGAVLNQNSGIGCTVGNPWGDLGASGGGGGAGGCGGESGGSAGGGGGSFAIFLSFDATPQTPPILRGNLIRRGFGGRGGTGGSGGLGGLSGQGASGGGIEHPAWCAGAGGSGGRGGNGGAGGGGGGGCGGASYGVATTHIDPGAYLSGNRFELPGTAETGGAAGTGGSSPAGETQSGAAGQMGPAGDVIRF
ncbi:MAG: hypothetical protein JRF33_09655 [Deltaproteobacteria bacterium]|nr:hypothetical protein [Deltaproteobacteria bacterium]